MPAASPERIRAIESGLKTYKTARPCKRGHFAARFVSNWGCVECHSENAKKFNQRNPKRRAEIVAKSHAKNYRLNRDIILKKNREWRAANKEKFAQTVALHRERNREKAKRLTRKWQKDNPAKVRAQSNRRRVRKLGAEGHHTADDLLAIRARQKNKCAFCRIKINGAGQLDHIKPLSKGGTDWPRNLQFLCKPCNLSKSARDQINWAQSRGLLL